MSEETDELKRLAQKATPGPWKAAVMHHEDAGWVDTEGGTGLTVGYEGEMKGDDVRFIAAANPAVVLGLLHELGTLRDSLDSAEAALKGQGDEFLKIDRDLDSSGIPRAAFVSERVHAALERLGRLEDFARLFADIAESAIRHHEWKAAGSKGMQAPFHGEFAHAPTSVISDLRRLAKQAREALKP